MIGRIALAAAIASEGLAFYTIAEWLAAGFPAGQHETIPAIGFATIALVAFAVPRAVQWLDLRPAPEAAVLALAAYVVIYGALRLQFAGDFALWDLGWMVDFVRDPGEVLNNRGPVIAGALFVIILWARAALRSGQDIELETLVRSVTLPFVVVTAVVALSVYTERAGIVGRAGAAYYVVAILSLALAQLSLSGTTFGELRAGGAVATLLALTLGAASACVVLFWLVFGVIGPVVGPILERAAFLLVIAILTPFAWTLEFVLSHLLGESNPFPSITLPEGVQGAAERSPDESTSTAARSGIYAVRILMLLLALSIVAAIVAFYTRIRRRAGRPAPDGEASSAGGSFREDASAALRSLFRRGGHPAQSPGSSEARRLYLAMIEQARREGVVREPADTPDEIVPRVAAVIEPPVARAITDAFVQSRYAGREPGASLVAELQRRWTGRRT